MAQRILTPDTLLDRKTAAHLFNDILGYGKASAAALSMADRRGTGPIQTRFGREVFYRAADALDWLEQKVGCTIKEAVERGRLRLPVDADLVLWSDDLPVLTAEIE